MRKRLSRRQINAALAALSITFPLAAKAGLYSHGAGGGWGSGGGSILYSINLPNQSNSVLAAGSVTQLIGIACKKGDISSGTWPQFSIANTGVAVPCTILSALATTWSDGSLKFVPVALQIPVSVDGNDLVIVNVVSGGSLPSASSRGIADFTNSLDPRVRITGLDNLSGQWIADMAGPAVFTETYGNGSAWWFGKARFNFAKSGTPHGQLVCDFYLASLANISGSLKGLRILGKVKLPYYDVSIGGGVSNQQNWVTLSQLQLTNGSSVLFDSLAGNSGTCGKFGSAGAFKFAFTSGSQFTCVPGGTNYPYPYSTLHLGDSGYAMRLSGSSLPTGLSTGTTYFLRTVSTRSNMFSLSTTAPAAIAGSLITPRSSGSGTVTPYPMLPYFGGLFIVNTNGDPIFVQGAGSDSSDTTLIHSLGSAPNPYGTAQSYLIATGLIPPYNLAITANSNIGQNILSGNQFPESLPLYWPMAAEPILRSQDDIGERDDIGVIPAWYVRHFFTHTAGDRQFARVVNLCGMQMAVGIENSGSLTLPCVNNGPNRAGGTYSGMPAPVPSFVWFPGGGPPNNFGSYTDYTDQHNQIAGFSNQSAPHFPGFCYYPYLFTGEPWHLDGVLEFGNNAVYQQNAATTTAAVNSTTFEIGGTHKSGNCRNVLGVNSTTTNRYGCTTGYYSGGNRAAAWATRDLALASAICPDSHPACSSYKQYFSDMRSDSAELPNDLLSAMATPLSFLYGIGMWSIPENADFFTNQYQCGYLCSALFLGAQACEDTNFANAGLALTTYFIAVQQEHTGWPIGAEHATMRTSASYGANPVTSWNSIAFGVSSPTISWTPSGFTWATSKNPQNYAMGNGDILYFPIKQSDNPYLTPGGFSQWTPYYVVNYGNGSFGLSPTIGGAAQAPTDSQTNQQAYLVWSNPASTGSQSNYNSVESFNTNILHNALYYGRAVANAMSLTLPTNIEAAISDLQTRETVGFSQSGASFATDPKYSETMGVQVGRISSLTFMAPGLFGLNPRTARGDASSWSPKPKRQQCAVDERLLKEPRLR